MQFGFAAIFGILAGFFLLGLSSIALGLSFSRLFGIKHP
jgi:hypothetical protein